MSAIPKEAVEAAASALLPGLSDPARAKEAAVQALPLLLAEKEKQIAELRAENEQLTRDRNILNAEMAAEWEKGTIAGRLAESRATALEEAELSAAREEAAESRRLYETAKLNAVFGDSGETFAQVLESRAALREEVERMKVEREWRPIETAPKNDSVFLVWFPESATIGYGYYAEASYGYPAEHRFFWFDVEERVDDEPVTHWLPLPSTQEQAP